MRAAAGGSGTLPATAQETVRLPNAIESRRGSRSYRRRSPMSVPVTDSAGGAMRAITLSRQYGCGGGEIAIRVARLLGWSLVDHQLVAGVASQLGIAEQQVASLDERAAGFVSRVIDSLLLASPEVPITRDNLPANPSQLYHEAVQRLIHEAIERGNVVIVGRGGQAMLQERPDVLHVRVVAPLAQRIDYVA